MSNADVTMNKAFLTSKLYIISIFTLSNKEKNVFYNETPWKFSIC